MKKWGKTFLGLLLCAALAMGLLPGMAIPAMADGEKTISGLGTGTISNPTSGSWNKVYFGSKDPNQQPLLFNVLKNGETNFGGNTLLLDCASVLPYQKFDNDGSPNQEGHKANEWAISDIRTWLNGNFKDGRFTTAEISAIAASSKSAKGSGDGNEWNNLGWASLTGEKIFESYAPWVGEYLKP